jgi:hypothetical protein
MGILFAGVVFIAGLLELLRWPGKVLRENDEVRVMMAIPFMFLSLLYIILSLAFHLSKVNATTRTTVGRTNPTYKPRTMKEMRKPAKPSVFF